MVSGGWLWFNGLDYLMKGGYQAGDSTGWDYLLGKADRRHMVKIDIHYCTV